jgi:hypothetical protein
MVQHNRQTFFNQVELLWRQFAQAPGLPFGDMLTVASVQRAFGTQEVLGYDCVYTAVTTVRNAGLSSDGFGPVAASGSQPFARPTRRRGARSDSKFIFLPPIFLQHCLQHPTLARPSIRLGDSFPFDRRDLADGIAAELSVGLSQKQSSHGGELGPLLLASRCRGW